MVGSQLAIASKGPAAACGDVPPGAARRGPTQGRDVLSLPRLAAAGARLSLYELDLNVLLGERQRSTATRTVHYVNAKVVLVLLRTLDIAVALRHPYRWSSTPQW